MTMKSTNQFLTFKYFVLCFTLLFSSVNAEELTLKQVKERKELARQTIKNAQQIKQNPMGVGDTPLSTMIVISDHLNQSEYQKAAQHFDFSIYGKNFNDHQKQQTIRKLNIIWSKHHSLDLTTLSNDPLGNLNDGLQVDLDLLGIIKSTHQDVPIYLQRITNQEGKQVWKISSNAIAKTSVLWDEFGYPPIAESISSYLPNFTVLDMQNWQFICFLLIIITSWYFTALVRWVLTYIVSVSKTYKQTMSRFIRIPLRLFLFFVLLQWATTFLGLSLNARVWIDSGILSYLATIFLSLGIIEFSFALYISRSNQDKNLIALLKPMVSTLKIIIVAVIILNWFHAAGFNITAIITGLGIGSLAVALAAQKSLENVFGAFTLFFARPIKPGDMCKFGHTQGRVEEINLRSTKIRKLDRKVVYVPNSTIASMELENITEIDNRRYLKHFRIRLNTSTNRLHALVVAIRQLIDQHKETIPLERYVRFEHVDEDAFVIVVNTYVTTSGRVKYKEIEERINFEILEIIDQHEIELAIPEQYISLQKHSAQ